MIREANAVRFDRQTVTGRNQPLHVVVETSDADQHEVVLKPSLPNELGVEGLANELLGSLLAADLGLPVNEPFLVRLNAAFIEGLGEPKLQERLRKSNQLAFASRTAGAQWHRWQSFCKIAEDQRPLALSILAFDAFIANNDRSPKNPNLLVRGKDWRLIDHEAAFSFRMKIAPPCRPWATGNLNLIMNRGSDSEHLFAHSLKGVKELDVTAVRTAWSRLSDARLVAYQATLPVEWEQADAALRSAITHIANVRDKIDSCLEELARVLS